MGDRNVKLDDSGDNLVEGEWPPEEKVAPGLE